MEALELEHGYVIMHHGYAASIAYWVAEYVGRDSVLKMREILSAISKVSSNA